jgi:hypothetical protein
VGIEQQLHRRHCSLQLVPPSHADFVHGLGMADEPALTMFLAATQRAFPTKDRRGPAAEAAAACGIALLDPHDGFADARACRCAHPRYNVAVVEAEALREVSNVDSRHELPEVGLAAAKIQLQTALSIRLQPYSG